MRKITLIALMAMFCIITQAQKKGTVYAQHKNIDVIQQMWAAFVSSDEEKLLSFFDDSLYMTSNGNWNEHTKKSPKERMVSQMQWWTKEFENLEVVQHKPAYPDAIQYKGENMMVQDWIIFKGFSKSSGITLNLPFHNLYFFNKDGKISAIAFYFDNDVFEDIRMANETVENGTIYKSHPYIVNVRKLLNAIYVKKDFEEWITYYNPKTSYWNSTMKVGETIDFDELKELAKQRIFDNDITYSLTEVGYPDCMHYTKDNMYVVYAWWNMKESSPDGTSLEYPMMTTHNFDKDGKVIGVYVYFSTNHKDK